MITLPLGVRVLVWPAPVARSGRAETQATPGWQRLYSDDLAITMASTVRVLFWRPLR
jgi:hypothetical protein